LTQEDLAERSGLDRSYIGGVERGERNPTLSVIERIAGSLGVSLAELFSYSAKEPRS
jgi:transcriptional regulator with XRE-family HTH domain